MTDRRLTARLVLAAGVALGLGTATDLLLRAPEQVGLASDVYAAAGRALLDGQPVYEAAPAAHPEYRYLYPPIVALAFLPHGLLGQTGALAIQTGLNVLAGLGTALVISRALARRGVGVTRVDFGLLVGTVLLSTHGSGHLINGQTTAWVAFAVAAGLAALDRRREHLAGAAFAGAALIKVFPAAVGLWLLRARARRAVGVALVVGAAGLLAGLVLGVEQTAAYAEEVLLGRLEDRTFDGRPEPTDSVGGAQRQVAALLGLGSPATALVAVAVLAPALAAVYAGVDLGDDVDRQAGALATLAVTLLALPLQPRYALVFLYPLAVLLYTLPGGRARTVLLLGTAVSSVRLGYESVRAWTDGVDAAPLEAGLAALRAGLTVVQPPTLGTWLLVFASVLIVRR